jgi:hypothetical protein
LWLTLPVADTLNRFLDPLCVFILGMTDRPSCGTSRCGDKSDRGPVREEPPGPAESNSVAERTRRVQ